MKNPMRVAFAVLLLAVMALLPAFAQVAPAPTLSFSGNVQICQSAAAGSSCTPATPGQALPPGSHLMVGQGATARLTYDTGAIVNFTEPGLYTVNSAAGTISGTMTASSVVAANTGFIAFAGLIVAAGVSSSALDDDENLLVPLSD